MAIADRFDELIAKAKDAENQAEVAKDAYAKSTWLRVASGYRDLAKVAENERRERNWPL